MTGGMDTPPMTEGEARESITSRRKWLRDCAREAREIERKQKQEAAEQVRAERARVRALILADLPTIEANLAQLESDPLKSVEQAEQFAAAKTALDRHAPGWRRMRREREAAERQRAKIAARPGVRFETIELVHVPLVGKHGAGRSFVMDAADWRRVSAVCGEDWMIAQTGKDRRESVVSPRRQAVEGARKLGYTLGRTGIVPLARLIAEAEPYEMVFHADGDVLNLRYDNLQTASRTTLAAFDRVLQEDDGPTMEQGQEWQG